MSEKIGILDLPDIALMSVTTLDELLDEYERIFRVRPEAVCLPATSSGGVTYESELGIRNVSPKKEDDSSAISSDKQDLLSLAISAQRQELDVYISINPSLPYV